MTIAQAICYALGIEFVVLLAIDIWLGVSGREMITTAMRDDNSASGWIVAGICTVLLVHLFALPYLIQLWHWVMSK